MKLSGTSYAPGAGVSYKNCKRMVQSDLVSLPHRSLGCFCWIRNSQCARGDPFLTKYLNNQTILRADQPWAG